MTGEALYKKLSQRDYSGSDADKYAQLLKTLFLNLHLAGQEKEFYEVLQIAEDSGKKITVSNTDLDEYTIDSLSLV